ncbi:hypothetical protein GCM10009868_01820 [Terrabacter aerolatus]|uniref:DUF3566 domain-containing protein n=1 Tax=Terrabacter aerolatus TaxID=422442 RepID=A0A512D2K6_9MICO|nr:DUF3566 domain-containing protein [Terrabacter aerolatus]GEO30701.1 hypothetical protein TAE01_25110 [Terrabacter aerolatus]
MSATSPEGAVSGSGASTRTGSAPGSGNGQNGSYYASNGASGSTSGASGASEPATSLSRGAVTNRTAPTQRVGAGKTDQPAASGPAAAATGARTATAPRKHKGPRRVRLAVARVDPWSVMKMSFLLSVALGIAGVVLTAVLWMILSTMNVFSDIEGVLQSLQTTTSDPFSIKDYVGFGRVVSLSIVIGVIDVILMTAIATVMAFLYNICSALVGGVQLTLTDD